MQLLVRILTERTRGSGMSNRFRYEPQTTLQKLAARFRHPRSWREKITPYVFDNESGIRLQLACDEEELIRRLDVSMPGDKEWPLSPTTLDDVANAVMQRRLGYVFAWTRICSLDTPRRNCSQRKRSDKH